MTVPTSTPPHDHHASSAPERISVDLLKSYIGNMTSSWFGEHDLPPDAVEELAPYADDAAVDARRHEAWEVLRAGLWLLLTTPGLDLEVLATDRYRYDDAEMREMLAYLYTRLYGPLPRDAATAENPFPNAVLDWDESGTDWLVRHGRLHRIRSGDTLRSIAAEHRLPLAVLLERNLYYRDRFRPDAPLPVRDETVRLTP